MLSIQRFPTLTASFLLAFLLLAFFSPRAALGEVITLKNNDRVTGKVVEDNEETLTLEHPTLGRILVPKSDIKSKTVAKKDGNDVNETMDRMGIEAGSTHEMQKTEKKESEVVAQEEPELPPATGVFGTRVLQDWKRTFAVGLKGEEGDSISQDWNFSLRGSYEDETKKWDFLARYIMESDDRKNSERKGHARLTRDWFNPDSRWYNYAHLRYDYDRYKYWKHRAAPLAGRGYKFFWEEDLKFRLRAGLGGRRDWGTENDFKPEGEMGLQLDWHPLPLQRIELNASIFPDFDDTGEYRTVSNLVWALRFSEDGKLTLRFGADHTYDSKINPQDDDERRYDLLYYGALGLDF